jgi:hypothetical protein
MSSEDTPALKSVATTIKVPTVKKSNNRQKRTQTHDRHKKLIQWILKTFPHVTDANERHILDVAGGKGELAARLSMCHKLSVIMVEPRIARVEACYRTKVLPKLPLRWQHSMEEHQAQNPNFISERIASYVSQFYMYFTDETVATSVVLQVALKKSSLLIGLHADNATEAIVNAALHYKVPFVVIPCCVFGNFFQDRCLKSGAHVQSYEQFCNYLLEKDHRFVKETLPFPGRNTAIWWNGV